MVVHVGYHFKDHIELFFGHSLYNEAFVMAKEEKTPTRPSSFACFKDLISVLSRV